MANDRNFADSGCAIVVREKKKLKMIIIQPLIIYIRLLLGTVTNTGAE